MLDQQTIEVQQGIWIDERWIRSAGLGHQVQVQPGGIRIVAGSSETEEHWPDMTGWDVLRSLGSDAQPGQLQNAAEEHDRYLYGKGR